MGIFVAGLVIIVGLVMIISGVDGTGLSLFEGLTGRTVTTKGGTNPPSAIEGAVPISATGTIPSTPANTTQGGVIAA